jgi:hypothetical protein
LESFGIFPSSFSPFVLFRLCQFLLTFSLKQLLSVVMSFLSQGLSSFSSKETQSKQA